MALWAKRHPADRYGEVRVLEQEEEEEATAAYLERFLGGMSEEVIGWTGASSSTERYVAPPPLGDLITVEGLVEAAKRARGGGKNVAPAIRREAGLPEPSEWDMSTGIWSEDVEDDETWYTDASLEHHEIDVNYPDENYDESLHDYYNYEEGYWIGQEEDMYSVFEEAPPGAFRDDQLYNENDTYRE